MTAKNSRCTCWSAAAAAAAAVECRIKFNYTIENKRAESSRNCRTSSVHVPSIWLGLIPSHCVTSCLGTRACCHLSWWLDAQRRELVVRLPFVVVVVVLVVRLYVTFGVSLIVNLLAACIRTIFIMPSVALTLFTGVAVTCRQACAGWWYITGRRLHAVKLLAAPSRGQLVYDVYDKCFRWHVCGCRWIDNRDSCVDFVDFVASCWLSHTVVLLLLLVLTSLSPLLLRSLVWRSRDIGWSYRYMDDSPVYAIGSVHCTWPSSPPVVLHLTTSVDRSAVGLASGVCILPRRRHRTMRNWDRRRLRSKFDPVDKSRVPLRWMVQHREQSDLINCRQLHNNVRRPPTSISTARPARSVDAASSDVRPSTVAESDRPSSMAIVTGRSISDPSSGFVSQQPRSTAPLISANGQPSKIEATSTNCGRRSGPGSSCRCTGRGSVYTRGRGEEAPVAAPDGGWGWFVAVAAFVVNFIVDGVCLSYGVFYVELRENFGHDSVSKIAFIGSLTTGACLFVGQLFIDWY